MRQAIRFSHMETFMQEMTPVEIVADTKTRAAELLEIMRKRKLVKV